MNHSIVVDELTEVTSRELTYGTGNIEFVGIHDLDDIIDSEFAVQIHPVIFKELHHSFLDMPVHFLDSCRIRSHLDMRYLHGFHDSPLMTAAEYKHRVISQSDAKSGKLKREQY